jgi:hypothetical protein
MGFQDLYRCNPNFGTYHGFIPKSSMTKEVHFVCPCRDTPPSTLALGNFACGNAVRALLCWTCFDAYAGAAFSLAGMGNGSGEYL